jgi:ABC-type oligopeptide transport system substrate-binding subunit
VPLNDVGIVALTESLLEVTLETPHTCFLELVSTPLFFPLPNDNDEPTDFNGPFMLTQWKRNESIQLSQNPFHHSARFNKIEQIQISTERDPYTAFEKFQKEELDFIGDPISPMPLDVINCSEQSIIRQPVSRVFWIHCNLHSFPFYNKALRKALNLSLNRHLIIEKALKNQIPLFSPLPLKYSQTKGYLEGNPNEANRFLKQALHELKFDKDSFPPITFTHSNLSFEKPLVSELARQWKETLGITVVLQELPWYEFSAALEKGDFQLGGIYRRDLFSNPLFYFSFFKQSPQNPYSLDQVYTRHCELFAQKGNDGAILKQLEGILMEEMPVIPIAQQNYSALVSPKMQDFAREENGCLNLRRIISEMD